MELSLIKQFLFPSLHCCLIERLIICLAVSIYYSSACIPHGDDISCHESCLECSSNSICNDPKRCTSCKPDEYKISKNYNDSEFKCNLTCIFDCIESEHYFYCDVPKSYFDVIETTTFKTQSLISTPGVSPAYTKSENPNIIYFCIVLTFMGLFLITIFIIVIFFKSRKLSHDFPACDVEKHSSIQPLIKFQTNKISNKIIYNNLEIITDVNEFKILKLIAGGNYSRVYEGTLRNESVAIKVALNNGRKSIHNELRIYDKISHSNIVKPLGVHLGIENALFMPMRKYNLSNYFIDYGQNLTTQKLTIFCIQIADAMKYLHQMNILHCDLKIDNILVNDENGENLEISDFGCAIDSTHKDCDHFIGTESHTSYELLKKCYIDSNFQTRASRSSDVWAYAVTVWQIFSKTLDLPKDFKSPREIVENYEKGKKLPKPLLVSEYFWRHAILQCFDLDPKSRPSMEEIYNDFLTISIDGLQQQTDL